MTQQVSCSYGAAMLWLWMTGEVTLYNVTFQVCITLQYSSTTAFMHMFIVTVLYWVCQVPNMFFHYFLNWCCSGILHIHAMTSSKGLGYIFSPSAYSNTKRKKVKPEGNDYLQKTHHNWTKANEPQRPCFKQDTKANQWWVKAMWALCTLCLLWKK